MAAGLREAARALGISHVALKRAADVGRVKRAADGSFDIETCRIALMKNTNPKKSASGRAQQRTGQKPGQAHDAGSAQEPVVIGPSSSDNSTDKRRAKNPEEPEKTYNEAVRRREWLRVEKDEIGLAKTRGELVELTPINAWFSGVIIKARDELLRIGPELRDRLACESDPIKCEELVAERVRRSLEYLAEYRPPSE